MRAGSVPSPPVNPCLPPSPAHRFFLAWLRSLGNGSARQPMQPLLVDPAEVKGAKNNDPEPDWPIPATPGIIHRDPLSAHPAVYRLLGVVSWRRSESEKKIEIMCCATRWESSSGGSTDGPLPASRIERFSRLSVDSCLGRVGRPSSSPRHPARLAPGAARRKWRRWRTTRPWPIPDVR
jgi:hypothetical protein